MLLSAAILSVGCGREQRAAPVTVAPATATATPTACVDLRASGAARVRMENFRFVPACFSIGSRQGLSLFNGGGVTHNFTIPDTLIALDTSPGEHTNTEAIGGVVKPGRYRFHCTYHAGMTGTMRVLP